MANKFALTHDAHDEDVDAYILLALYGHEQTRARIALDAAATADVSMVAFCAYVAHGGRKDGVSLEDSPIYSILEG